VKTLAFSLKQSPAML